MMLQRAIILIKISVLFLISSNCIATLAQRDADQPLHIQSDYVEFDDQSGTATYRGNVIADQGTRHLTASTLIIYRGKDNKVELAIAIGNPASFRSQPNLAKPMGFGKAKTIKYFPEEDKIYFIKNAELEQNGDIVKGNFLTYYFATGVLKSKASPEKRATVILVPKRGN